MNDNFSSQQQWIVLCAKCGGRQFAAAYKVNISVFCKDCYNRLERAYEDRETIRTTLEVATRLLEKIK